MQLYEVSTEGSRATFRRKQADAHAEAKLLLPRHEVRIRLYEYPSDQQTFQELFNGFRPDGQLLKTWRLTPRGGLQQLELTSAGREIEPVREEQPAEETAPTTETPEAFWARMNATRKTKEHAA